MNYLTILREDLAKQTEARAAAVERMEAVVSASVAEQRSELTEAENTDFQAALAAVTEVDSKLDQVRSRIAELEKVEAGREAADAAIRSAGFTVPNISRGRDPWDTSELRFASRNQVHGQVRSALESERTLTGAQKESVERLLLLDTRSAVLAKSVLVTGHEAYRTAFAKYVSGSESLFTEEERSKVMESRANSLTDNAGGYAVPFTLDPTIISTNAGSVNPFRAAATIKTTVTDQWQGVTSSGMTAAYEAEATQVADGSPTLGAAPIPVHKAHAYARYSIEIGMDWQNLLSDIGAMISEAKDNLEATKMALGSGTGEITGVITAVAAYSSGASLVAPTTAEAFAVEDLYKVMEALPAKHRMRASWAADLPTYNKIRQFGTADSHAMWERLAADQPATILGRPALESSSIDSSWNVAATAANYILLFGDMSKYYVVDRVGMTVEYQPLATGADGRPTGERGIYAYWRNGANIVDGNAFRLLNVATAA